MLNVATESGLANINAGQGWIQSGNQYTQSGSGPTLTFLIKTGAGNLTLTPLIQRLKLILSN